MPPATPRKPLPAPPTPPVTKTALPTQEPVQAQLAAPVAPKKLRVKVKHGYAIYVPYLGRRILPEETAELDDHEWLRKQILLNTFIEV